MNKKCTYLFFLLIIFSCVKEEKDIKVKTPWREVSVDYGVQAFSKIQFENDSIIMKFEDCINSKSYHEFDKFWDKGDRSFFKEPYDDLHYIINKNYPAYEPTVISIQKLNKFKFLLKIAIIGNPEGFFSVDYIYNLYVIRQEKGFVFKNTISDNLKNWKTTKIDNILYYHAADKLLDKKNVQRQVDFESYLIDFLQEQKIDYRYVICKDINQIYKLLGFDFVDTMFFSNQGGALSYPHQNIFFSGNNSEFYPHETVHIYNYKKFGNIHPILDEGLATYLGGSKGMEYHKHITILARYINQEGVSLIEYLFENRKRHTIIGVNTSIIYSFGAFLCHLVMEKFGREKLFYLLNDVKSDEELLALIIELFKISQENFDEYFLNELNIFVKNYASK